MTLENSKKNENDLIDVKEVINLLSNKKKLIISITSIFFVLSLIYSLLTPKLFTSYAILAETNSSDNNTLNTNNYSSIANLAGINIPRTQQGKSYEAIARMNSFNFFSQYFLSKINLENLVSKNESDISKLEAYEKYREVLKINIDDKTQFVTISIDHANPKIAKKWVDIVINNINETMREEEKKLTLKNIDFLNDSIKENNVTEIEKTLIILLKDEMQKLMLITANNDYVFKKIEPPFIPEKSTSLSKILLIIFISMLGMMFGIFLALFKYYFFKTNY
jgi:uncharacterized protein involved in exopolysaccharide biosynthesis